MEHVGKYDDRVASADAGEELNSIYFHLLRAGEKEGAACKTNDTLKKK